MGILVRYRFTHLLLIAVLSCPAWAQELEFELPDTFELLPGQLVATFGDTVQVDHAMRVSEGLPLDSFHVEFFPVLLAARWVTLPQAGMRDSLLAHPNARSVLTGGDFMGRSPEQAYVLQRAPDLVPNLLTGLAVLFEPHTSVDEVLRFASLHPSIRPDRVDKRPNEILLYFDPSIEEAILGRLEDSPLVEYISYVAEP